MQRVARDYKEKDVTKDGKVEVSENVKAELRRLEKLRKLDWHRGDYYQFED